MADYIYVQTNGEDDLTGFRLDASIVLDLGFNKGIDTSDLALPSTARRKLLPVSGLKEDYNINIELIDDGTNKGYSVNNTGDLTPLSKNTTAEQLLFLLEDIMIENLDAVYNVYIEWLNRTYTGILTIRGIARGTDFYNTISLTATLKVGDNILAV